MAVSPRMKGHTGAIGNGTCQTAVAEIEILHAFYTHHASANTTPSEGINNINGTDSPGSQDKCVGVLVPDHSIFYKTQADIQAANTTRMPSDFGYYKIRTRRGPSVTCRKPNCSVHLHELTITCRRHKCMSVLLERYM